MRAPAHLDEQAKAKWKELAGQVDVGQPGNADGLAAYCVAWSEWKTARVKVDELGSVIRSPAGFPAISPYVTVAAQAERRMRQWATALGIVTRTARRKEKAPDQPAPVDDELQSLLLADECRRLIEAPAPLPRSRRRARR